MAGILGRAAMIIVASLALGGCHIYQSIGKSVGGFLHPVNGPDFVGLPNDQWDSQRNALLYFYRPHSQWASEEIESPSVYIDDRHYFNFRNNSYTWLEVYPGERAIDMRRPLLGLEGVRGHLLTIYLDHNVEGKVTVEAGKIYYFRYSEVSEPESLNPNIPAEDPLNKGDLRLVTREVAMIDMPTTKFLKGDPLAPNHAGTSIVEDNIDTDYKAQKALLQEERKEEIAKLKEQGFYRSGPWYWPFGGGPTKVVKADRKLKALDKSYADAKANANPKANAIQLAKAKDAEHAKPWWKLW